MIWRSLGLTGLMLPCFWGASDSEELYQKAMQACRQKNFRVCGKLLTQAAENNHPQAQARLAQMYKKGIGTKVDITKAEYWLTQYKQNTKKQNPNSFLLPPSENSSEIQNRLLDQAEMYFEQGQWQSAISHAQAALHIKKNPHAYIIELQALEQLRPEQYSRIDKAYRDALNTVPAPELMQAYGYFLIRHKDFEPAVNWFKSSLNNSPDPFLSYLGLAESHHFLGKSTEAIHWLNLAQQQNPDHEKVKNLRAIINP